MAGGCRKEFIQKVIGLDGEILYSKRYDYVAKKNEKEQVWCVYRREMEGSQWERIYKIPFDSVDNIREWNIEPGAFSMYRLEGQHKYN